MAINNVVNIKIKAVEDLSEKLDGIRKSTEGVSKGMSSLINSTGGLSGKLDYLEGKLRNVEIGSKEFNKLQKEIEQTKNKLEDANKGIGKFQGSIERMGPSFEKMRNYGALAFGGLSYLITKTTKDAGDLESSLKGLQSVVEGTGQDFGEAQKFLDSYTKDGLVPMKNASTALKNLLAKGFNLKEATVLMDRFKDSASFGRQASLSLGDAVQSATEGIKNENSILVDNAGVTKNVSVMVDEYAKSIGKTVNQLTEAEQREAIYQGIIKETAFQVGDAQKASEGYQGQLARLNATKMSLSATIGTALMPVMTMFMETITPIIEKVSLWIAQNSELTAKIVIGITVIGGLIAIIGTLGLAIPTIVAGFTGLIVVAKGLGVALSFLVANPIGLTIVAITALGTAMYLLYKNWDEVKANLVILWTQLKIDISAIADIILNYVMGVFTAMSDFVTEKIEWMSNKAKEAKEFLASIMNSYAQSSVGQAVGNLGTAVYDMTHGAKAVGGPVTAGSTYRVNEQGQEFFTPSKSGYITPSGKGGGITFTMGNVNVYNEADENRLIEKMKRMLTQEAKNYNLGIS